MALLVKVGTITARTTPGSQAYTGVGFLPKALFMWCTFQTAAGAAARAFLGFGFCASNEEACWGIDSVDASATTELNRQFEYGSLVGLSSSVNLLDANLASFDADGFTLNWTINQPGTALICGYLALGGDDLTNAFVKTFTSPTSLGTQALTGVGFQPDCGIFLANANGGAQGRAGTHHASGLGFASSPTARAACGIASEDGAAAADTYHAQQTDKVIHIPYVAGSVLLSADLNSFDADGATIDWTSVDSVGHLCAALFLKGGGYQVVEIDQKTTPGNQAYTGFGFTPAGALLASVNDDTDGAIEDHLRLSIGAVSATDERNCVWVGDVDAADPSQADRDLDTAAVIKMMTAGTPTIEAEADLVSFDPDGLTLNWTAADATARKIIALAFEGEPAGITLAGSQPAASGSLSFTASITLGGNQPNATGTISAQQEGAVTLAGNQPAASGTLNARQSLARTLTGNQPSATGLLSFSGDQVSLAGSQPSATGALDFRYRIDLVGNQPSASGFLAVLQAAVDLAGEQPAPSGRLWITFSETYTFTAEVVEAQAFEDFILSIDLPSRLRGELFEWQTTLVPGSLFAVEQIGPKVGTGIIETISDFSYSERLDQAGRWSMTVAASDPAIAPILDGTANVLLLTREGLGPRLYGRIVNWRWQGQGQIQVDGQDLSVKLGDRSSLWRLKLALRTPLGAYQTTLSYVTWLNLQTAFEAFGRTDIFSRSFGGQTILEVLNDLGVICDAHWRWDPVLNKITVGTFGEDSGLIVSSIDEDDPALIRDGALVIVGNPQYEKSSGPMANFIVAEGSNQATGTAIALNHAHNRGFKLGDCEPLYEEVIRPEIITEDIFGSGEINFSGGGGERTVPVPLPLASYPMDVMTSPGYPGGETLVDLPGTNGEEQIEAQRIKELSPYAFMFRPEGSLPWIIGSLEPRCEGLAQQITIAAPTEVAYIGVRTGSMGVLTGLHLRILGDDGGLPDEGNVIAAARKPTTMNVIGPAITDTVHLGLAPCLPYFCFNPPLVLQPGTYHLAASNSQNFGAFVGLMTWIPFAMAGLNTPSHGGVVSVRTARAAVGTLTFTGLPTAGETFVVGTRTYTFVSAGASVDGQVNIGADATATASNASGAINGTHAANTENPDASASATDGVVAVSASSAGPDGNGIVFTEALSNATMDGGGVLGGSQAGFRGWEQDAAGSAYSWVFEVSGRLVGDTMPLVEGTRALVVNESSTVRPDSTNPWGHPVFFMRDLDAIEANWQVERAISFVQGLDTADGLEQVWPGSDALYDACATYLERASTPFERLVVQVTNAYNLPKVGQTVWAYVKDWVEDEDGVARQIVKVNKAMHVLGVDWQFSGDGVTHTLTLANVPEDFFDTARQTQRWERFFRDTNEAQAELATSSNSGANYDPTKIDMSRFPDYLP